MTGRSFSPMILFALAATCAVATCAFVTRARAEDWPNWRGPRHNGISVEQNWKRDWGQQPPPIVWQGEVGIGFSAVVVRESRLLTLGNHDNVDTLVCLDARTGETLWRHSYSSPLDDRFFEGGPTSTPTIDQDRVYSLGRQGDLFCLDVASGTVHWSLDLLEETGVAVPGWGFAASPVIVGDHLLLNAGEGGTVLDKRDGSIVWTSGKGEAGYTTPVVRFAADRTAWTAVMANGKHYFEIDGLTGARLWERRWLTRFGCNAADPLIHDQQILISSGYNRGTEMLDTTEGEPASIWATKGYQNQFASSILLDGHVYGFDGNTHGESALKCLQWSTGDVVWSAAWERMGTLMAADGQLLLLSEAGELVIAPASPDGFQPTTRVTVLADKSWTVPVLANGLLYCRGATGKLVALDLRSQPVPQ